MRGLGVRGGRWWSLGGALRGFLRLDLRAQLMRGPGVQGSRWWYLGGALRSFLLLGVGTHWKRGDRWKLRCAPPRLRHRPPRTLRPGKECISTPRRKKLKQKTSHDFYNYKTSPRTPWISTARLICHPPMRAQEVYAHKTRLFRVLKGCETKRARTNSRRRRTLKRARR